MSRPHPSTFSDYELERLASASHLPGFDEIAHCFRSQGRIWAVYRSGDLWVKTPLPSDHPLAQPDE